MTVKNYRSIGSQTRFAVRDMTTLVGPNNEGKSNLLRALSLAMQLIDRWSHLPDRLSGLTELTGVDASMIMRSARHFGRSDVDAIARYSWADDYPLSKQDRKGTHPTVIRLRFELDAQEVKAFFEATGISNNGEFPVEISLTRSTASFGVVKPGRGAATHKAKASAIAKFIGDRLSFVSVPAIRTVDQAQGLVNELSRLRIRELARSEEYVQLVEKLNSLRQRAVEEVGAQLVGSIQRYLPSVTDMQVVMTDFARSDAVDDLLIDDGSVTSLKNKGNGVKSLVTLALIQELARTRSTSHSFILAVDDVDDA